MCGQVNIFSDKDIFETINIILNDTSSANDTIMRDIMDLYIKKFHGERSIVFVPMGNLRFKELIKYNMDEQFNKDYNEYYHKFDPLHLLQRSQNENPTEVVVQNIDYQKCQRGEYYNDFLLPQKMHYKLLSYLKTDKATLAKILLTKSKEAGNFSKMEIYTAKAITPYFAFALDYNEVKRKVKERDGLFRVIEDNLTEGIILLDSSKRIIHINSKAKELCSHQIGEGSLRNNIFDISPLVLKDCLEMVDDYKSNNLCLPRKRIFQSGLCTYSIYSKLISDQDNSNYFLVTINETNSSKTLKKEELQDVYHLSNREIDITNQLIKGLHNSEIAQNLFISEITVKKHLENIFHKMNVDNRASLVHKVLSGQNA